MADPYSNPNTIPISPFTTKKCTNHKKPNSKESYPLLDNKHKNQNTYGISAPSKKTKLTNNHKITKLNNGKSLHSQKDKSSPHINHATKINITPNSQSHSQSNPNPNPHPHSTHSPYTGLSRIIDKYFHISERGSTIATEIRGGTVGFLTLAYIVLLNPQVLSVSGIPYEYAASSTCLASCIATLICGIFGNIPVGCGPGVGLSAYFSYGMMPQMSDSQTLTQPYLSGLCMAFLSGAIVFVLTIPGIVTWIVNSLPHFIKVATIVGMGLFLAFVGMVDVGLVTAAKGQGNAILQLGDITDYIIILSLVNCLLIATLKYFRINGSLLICIILTSIAYFAISERWPTKFIDFPQFQNPLNVLNLHIFTHLPVQTAIESIISFVLILFLDVSGVTFAIAKLCGLSENQKTLVSFQKSAFIGTSIGSMIAAVLGCSPIIVCIETSSGAAAGARTGLSAVVISLFFFIAMFLGPLIGTVPAAATSPVLVFIGTLMMNQVGQIAWDNMRIAIPAFFCIAMMPFTYSISNGLFFGVIAYFLTWVSTGQWLHSWKLFGFGGEDGFSSFDEKLQYSNVTNPMKMKEMMDYSDIVHEYEHSVKSAYDNVEDNDENRTLSNRNASENDIIIQKYNI